jgi:uncharacterized membrane-anchored protein
MKPDGLEQILKEAHEIADAPVADARPWPIIMLTTLGAWLATMPIMVVIVIFSYDALRGSGGFLLMGALVAAPAFLSLFVFDGNKVVEQLAFPFLMAGLGLVAFDFIDSRTQEDGAIVTALVAAGAGLALPLSWHRTALGVTAGFMLMTYVYSGYGLELPRGTELWTLLHVQAVLWLLGRGLAKQPGAALRLTPFLNGWLVSTLLGLIYWSGPAFLASGALYGTDTARQFLGAPMREYVVSLACAVAGGVVLAKALPAIRQGWCLGIAVTLAAATFFMPGLGIVLLILACCIADGRYGFSSAAALVAGWTIGSAYYDLGWAMHHKAAIFALAGITIIAFCWQPLRALASPRARAQQVTHTRAGKLCIGMAGLVTLAIANATMLRNEIAIAKSEVAYIELMPVDPRSLAQGDYMRITFNLPPEPRDGTYLASRALVVAKRSNGHITKLVRWHRASNPLRKNEFLVELKYKGGRWMLASDAWFFREGDARRYAPARYGEFRIAPSGRALLVGLRGPNLEPL